MRADSCECRRQSHICCVWSSLQRGHRTREKYGWKNTERDTEAGEGGLREMETLQGFTAVHSSQGLESRSRQTPETL